MYKLIQDIKNIYSKFAFAKIDYPAMINSTVLFILAWFTVFWLFQFFTVVPAFSVGAKMLIYAYEIDFNSVNTASSDAQIWSDTDNIVNIFGTPAVMLSILIIAALIFLIKWDSDRLNMRRYLFWVVVCGAVRLFGNYIAGALFGDSFNVWNWNLVTDFLRLTTSVFFKYVFVVLAFAALYILFRFMSNQIKLLFNPYFANRINNLISSIFFPVVIGSVFLLMYNIPREPICEITCIVLMFLFTSFVLCRNFVSKYRGIAEDIEEYDDEPINRIPILILGFFVILKIFVDFIKGGLLLSASLYKRFIVENIILVSVALVVVLTLIIAVRIYRRRKIRDSKIFLKTYLESKDMVEQSISDENYKNFGIESRPKNMDRYLKGWVESLGQGNDAPQTEDSDKAKEVYGVKDIDLDKYKEKWNKSMK
ncbi:MAG: hypothetical protein IJ748_05250 [Bacteroidales bacterium]|nr:hypothetical protein [Bacteroidales bacterium]